MRNELMYAHKRTPLRELRTHVEKDLRLLLSGSAPVFLLSAMLAIGFIAAYDASISFSQSYNYYSSLPDFDLNELYAETIFYYWSLISFLWSLIIVVIAALFISQEKENGMLQYILTYRPRSWLVYISKLMTLFITIILIVLASIGIFQVVFFIVSSRSLPWTALLESCIYPIFAIVILSQLCILVSLLIKKKNIGMIATVCIVLSLFATSTVLTSIGIDEMMERSSDVPSHGTNPEYFPVMYKFIIVLNPMFLFEGIVSILDLSNDYQSGIFHQDYFQILGPEGYCGYIAITMLLYSLVSISAIQRGIPRRLNDKDRRIEKT